MLASCYCLWKHLLALPRIDATVRCPDIVRQLAGPQSLMALHQAIDYCSLVSCCQGA